jgi:hypothetical protein
MGAPAKSIELTEEEASTLKMLASAGTTEQRTAIRNQFSQSSRKRNFMAQERGRR